MEESEVRETETPIETTENKPKHIWWHTMKKVLVDIITIVFAVSLSIGFHSLNEHRKEKKDTEEFLKGLHTDLKKDISEMTNDIKKYENVKKGYLYLGGIQKGQTANLDSLNKYSPFSFNHSAYVGNSGRYEGFKASGKIESIENEDLQNDILILYEEKIPTLIEVTGFYNEQKLKLVEYAINHTEGFPAGNFKQVLASEPVKNRSKMFLNKTDIIINDYKDCLELMKRIVDQIDEDHSHKKSH